MTVAVDLGSGAVKIADGADASVRLAYPVDAELAARVGTTVPLIRRDGGLVVTQAPHDAYVRAVATALDGMAAESAAIVAPDWWSKRARELVEQSFQANASGPFRLVSPAQAAISASRDRRRLPTTVAVLDIGAESSSTTVLTEVDGVHRVVGRPSVLHGWAGNEIDRRLLHHVLGWLRVDGHGYEPFDVETVAAGRLLLAQVKAAKERLSTRPAATLTPDLPGANAELRLVRSEFDEVVRGTVDAIVAMLKASIATNAPEGAGAVVLIGGSVSIPLVTQVISVEVGLPVVLDDDPATLAVRGASTVEMPAAPRRRRWRRRKDRAARSGFDLNHAPAPDSEPYLEPFPEPEPEPEPGPSPESRTDVHEGEDTDGRLGSFIEASRREVAAQPEPEPEPVHVVVGAGAASRSNRTARWASAREESEWSGARRTWVDDDGRFQLRVNDRDYDVDMGTELASTSVTLLLIGRHVFVTLSENGELLRELLLNPDHDFRPE
jgi:hypothetical protein